MAVDQAAISVSPYKVTDDTFVIPQIEPAPPMGYFLMNSMIIKAAEPVIVDTGTPVYRETWMRHAWDIVDPEDVKWVFLTHDDRDHSGNIMQVLEACPNATLLTTWFMVGRMLEEFALPMERIRFLNVGESFEAGDRTLTAVRPPVFDNPTTRALFDSKSRVLWSVDAFATGVDGPVEDLADVPEAKWREEIPITARMLSPWHEFLDPAKFQKHLDIVASLPIEHIASCHGPAIHGRDRIEDVMSIMRTVPDLEPHFDFSQSEFEAMMAQMIDGAPEAEAAE